MRWGKVIVMAVPWIAVIVVAFLLPDQLKLVVGGAVTVDVVAILFW